MAELARLSIEELQGDAWAEEARKHVVEALAADPNGHWSKLRLQLLGDKLIAAVDQSLAKVDLMELLARAWAKLREIEKLPRDQTSIVEIGEYRFKRDLHPLVTVRFDPWVSDQLRFTLTVTAETKAVELKVRNRHIVAAGGGSCNLGLELKYGTYSLSGPVRLKQIDLPGEHRFKGEGIPIPASDAEETPPPGTASGAASTGPGVG